MAARNILDVRMGAARSQVQNVKSFAKSPKGVFETLDRTIKTFRQANRQTLRELGISRGILR